MELKDFIISKGLDASLADKFAEMMKLALEWNEKINITAIKTPEDFINKNIIDSLTLLGRPELASAERVMDLGTGGGYPGLPLALANPDKQFVLMDSVGKKLTVVSAIASDLPNQKLKLPRITATAVIINPPVITNNVNNKNLLIVNPYIINIIYK